MPVFSKSTLNLKYLKFPLENRVLNISISSTPVQPTILQIFKQTKAKEMILHILAALRLPNDQPKIIWIFYRKRIIGFMLKYGNLWPLNLVIYQHFLLVPMVPSSLWPCYAILLSRPGTICHHYTQDTCGSKLGAGPIEVMLVWVDKT